MNADFSQPQRQSKIGIIVMFFHAVQQYGRALWPVALVFIFRIDQMNKLWFLLAAIGLVVSIAVVAYLRYLNFTFFLNDANEEFIISEGIFSKTKTTIQLDKIQQVNISQNLLQRIISVYALDVDTAGSNKKEGNIKAISHELALALKARLLDNEKRVASSSQAQAVKPVEEKHPFISISFLSLMKVGITSNYIRTIGLLLASLITIYENVRNVGDYSDYGEEKIDNYFNNQPVLQAILIVICILLFAVLVINVIRIVVRYFNFKITRQKASLLLSFGLINTKSTIIKPEKVQITSVSQNYFQKKMNILELKIKQATSGEKEERKSAIEIPGCDNAEKDAILKLLFGAIPEKGVMLKPNFRKLGFTIFLAIVLPLCLFFFMAEKVEPRFYEFVYLVVPYVIFVGLVSYFGFRNSRLYIHDRFIIRQSGAWDIENQIIEPKKIQAITTSQLFWHKNINIGSLTLHTAGGNVSFQLGNYNKIKDQVNLWLYEMETSDSNWM